MVIHLIFLLLCPFFLFSAEFTANVNRNQVSIGETFTLNLTLKNGSAKGAPLIGDLNKIFQIKSQYQTNNTSIVNGTVTSSTTWKFTLSASNEGDITIPSMNIQTSEGILSSQPITIKVFKSNAANSTEFNEAPGINLSYEVSNANPFKNEPFIYTIKLASGKQLSNIQVVKFNVDDAIVETNGDPKVYSKVINGIPMGVVEFSYLITPLKPGALKIPSTQIQGLTPSERKKPRGSFFDDDFDFEPFAFIQGFDRLKSFSAATEDVVLNVIPPVSGMNPWLPAKSLTVEEIFDNNTPLQAGEPITRVITVSAIGLKSSQLPNLNEIQSMPPQFKIYADKPELKEELVNGSIKSYRKEQFTIIPQEGGTFTMPEISIPWWDLTKKERSLAIIPSKTIQILPAANQPSKNVSAENSIPIEPIPQETKKDPILYVLLASLTVLLIGAVIWMIILQKKIGGLTRPAITPKKEPLVEKYNPFTVKEEQSSKPGKKGKLNDLNPT